MLMNLHSLAWDDELARVLGLEGMQMPEIHPSSYRYGESDFAGVFARPVPITALIGDSHSAFVGERCYEPGSAKATLGTGCSVLLNAGNEAPNSYPSTVSTVGFSIPGRVDFALEGIIVSAGAVLTWMQRELGLFDDPSELDCVASAAGESSGVVVVPGHAGLGAPFWRMDARGSVHGLTFGSNKSHLLRAALESIPYQIRAILDAIRRESGIECRSIRVDGGISKNGFVTQWLADALGVPVRVYANPDVTARGAAFLAGIGAGIYSGIDELAALRIDESITEPGPGGDAAQDGYSRWRSVVDGLVR
jgi:glycerol kinase